MERERRGESAVPLLVSGAGARTRQPLKISQTEPMQKARGGAAWSTSYVVVTRATTYGPEIEASAECSTAPVYCSDAHYNIRFATHLLHRARLGYALLGRRHSRHASRRHIAAQEGAPIVQAPRRRRVRYIREHPVSVRLSDSIIRAVVDEAQRIREPVSCAIRGLLEEAIEAGGSRAWSSGKRRSAAGRVSPERTWISGRLLTFSSSTDRPPR
jgi:hypothetical protein